MIQERGLTRVLPDVGPANRDRDNLGARGVDRRAGFGKVLVFAGTDQ